tara:strand:+ start:21339 stop:21545 length:207 start_codon:yes stop_codon:yes gene_type:complete
MCYKNKQKDFPIIFQMELFEMGKFTLSITTPNMNLFLDFPLFLAILPCMKTERLIPLEANALVYTKST